MENSYLLQIEDFTNLSVNAVIEKLKNTSGIKLSDCKISDLVFFNGAPIYSGNGVYIYKNGDEFVYVGNCVARNFVERIPSHFDIRQGGWFNSMLRSVIKKKWQAQQTDEMFVKAAKEAFDKYSLILINYTHHNKDSINKLETLLRIVLNPYNGFKHKKLNDSQENLLFSFL
jgi:hypothetical protein